MMPSNIKSIINSQLKESVFKRIALNFAEKLFDSDPNEPGWKDVYTRNISDLFLSRYLRSMYTYPIKESIIHSIQALVR